MLARDEVPRDWLEISFPHGECSLTGWFAALRERVVFLSHWLDTGPPAAFWVGACFKPLDLLLRLRFAGVGLSDRIILRLQGSPPSSTARRNSGGLLSLLNPTDFSEASVKVYGLILHGAMWDTEAGAICDLVVTATQTEPTSSCELPPLWLVMKNEPTSPSAQSAAQSTVRKGSASHVPPSAYMTPLYATAERRDLLTYIELPCSTPNTKRNTKLWTMRGVALSVA